MNCKDCEALLHPYLDGEMDAAQRSDVDAHLKSCPECRKALEQFQTLQRALQQPGLRYTASDTLRQRLQKKLREADAREQRSTWPRYAAAAAVTLIAVALVWNFIPQGSNVPAADEDDAMVDSAVDQQQDAVKDGHLTELASSDTKAVQAWFSGKLAYTPPVPDLTPQGYTLVGARTDKVKGQPAAALTYRKGDDYVTLFVCAAQHGDKDLDTDSDDGYQVVYWTKGALSFWVVSKLDAASLKQLGQSLRQTV